jgi:hypothetical protein
MFQQIQKVLAGALCALTLMAAGAAPADAHEMVHGRAGQIRNLAIRGDARIAQRIAGEFVGLIHSVWMDHQTDTLYWILLARDGEQEISVAEATLDANDAITSQGEIAQGALKGATVSARGFQEGELFVMELQVSLGDTEVAFIQALEPVEETDQ